jgi:hypothetical protein
LLEEISKRARRRSKSSQIGSGTAHVLPIAVAPLHVDVFLDEFCTLGRIVSN